MPTLQDNARNAAVNAVTALLNGGDVQFRAAAEAVVGTVTLANPAFGAAAAGVAEMAAAQPDPNAAGGPVTHAVFRSSAGVEVFRASVTDTGGGGEIVLTELNFSGSELRLDSFTYTQPAS